MGHLSDAERVFAYRALRIARGDATRLPAFDDQSYVGEAGSGERTAAAWTRRGIAGGQPISVRALAFVTAGHVRHHLETLQSRYFR